MTIVTLYSHSYFQSKANMTMDELKADNARNKEKVALCRANKRLREAAVAAEGLAADQQQPALQGAAGTPGLGVPGIWAAGEQQAAQQKKALSAGPGNTTGSAGARSHSRSRSRSRSRSGSRSRSRSRSRSHSPLLFTSEEEEEE